nr:YqcC family protein [Thaumasiovibrio subtropicus]
MTKHQRCQQLLAELKRVLVDNEVWQIAPPEPSRLESVMPFSADMLSGEEWLQWVFIPRMTAVLEQAHPLPHGFEISPYFEEVTKGQPYAAALLEITQDLDRLMGEQ